MSELSGYLEETSPEETSPEAVEETPAVAETVPETPDPVQEYVAKYGGDTEAALKAAVEAQSLIGRQGQELGSIRQELQSLREGLTPAQEEVQQVPVTDSLVEWAQNIGYAENWQEGAQWALKNQPALYETIMEAVYETNPKDASRFEIRQAQEYQSAELLNRIGPAVAPLVANQHRDQFIGAWNDLKPSFNDIDEYSAQMMETAQRNPELLAALRNGDRDSQRRVIANLYYVAKGQSAAPLADVASQAAANAAQNAQSLRTAAAVGTATASAPVAPPATETPEISQWRQALNEELGLASTE